MQLVKNKIILSPTDLNKYLACKHYINLEKERLINNLDKLEFKNSLFEILAEKGLLHENNYFKFLKTMFKDISVVSDTQNNDRSRSQEQHPHHRHSA